MKMYFSIGDSCCPIMFLPNKDMDALIQQELERNGGERLVGYPLYYSPDGRLYPIPGNICEIDDRKLDKEP
jgi:hypothetical protein